MSQPFGPPLLSGFVPRRRTDDTDDPPADEVRANEADEDLDEFLPEAPATGGREGLPPSFRMRADEHYVEHLTRDAPSPPIRHVHVSEIDAPPPAADDDLRRLSASVAEFGVLHPLLVRRQHGRFALIAGSRRLAAALAAGLATVPCLVHDVDDETARRLADADQLEATSEGRRHRKAMVPGTAEPLMIAGARQFAESATTLVTCLGLLDEAGRPLREQVAMTLMRAEARRAAWQARAYAVLAGAGTVTPTRLSASSLLDAAADAVRSDPRLSGTSLAVASPNGAAPASGDESLVTLGVAGLVLALVLGVRARGVAAPVVEARARDADGWLWLDLVERQAAFEVAAVAAASSGDPFSWPGGHDAVVGLAVAQRVAALHGGLVEAVGLEPVGCRVSIGLAHRPAAGRPTEIGRG